MSLSKEDREDVQVYIDQEGFDYALRHKTSFDFIKDDEFHRLLRAYREAAQKIEDYIGS
jgi:hypothetical protein